MRSIETYFKVSCFETPWTSIMVFGRVCPDHKAMVHVLQYDIVCIIGTMPMIQGREHSQCNLVTQGSVTCETHNMTFTLSL